MAEQITAWALDLAAGKRLLLHACGLSDDNGGVIALVGSSGAGKTTAAVALGRQLGYVSDEVVAVDADGSVIAFERPLCVMGRGSTLTKSAVSPDELGLLRCPSPLRLRRIAFLERHTSREEAPRIQSIDLVAGILALIPQISYLRRLERPLCRVASALAGAGPVRLVLCGDREHGRDRQRPARRAAGRTAVASPRCYPTADRCRSAGLSATRSVRRRPVADTIRVDDRVVVLVGLTPIVLDGIGPTLWDTARDEPTMAELVVRVIEAHGPHPGRQRAGGRSRRRPRRGRGPRLRSTRASDELPAPDIFNRSW